MILCLGCNCNDYTKIQTMLFKANIYTVNHNCTLTFSLLTKRLITNLSIDLESKSWQTKLGKYIWPHVIYSLTGSLKKLVCIKDEMINRTPLALFRVSNKNLYTCVIIQQALALKNLWRVKMSGNLLCCHGVIIINKILHIPHICTNHKII